MAGPKVATKNTSPEPPRGHNQDLRATQPRAALAKLASCPHPDFNGKRGTSAPARQFGWQGRAGRGLPRRTGMRRDQPANALLARVGEVAITVSSSPLPP